MRRIAIHMGTAVAALAWSSASSAALTCADVEQFLLDKAKNVVCQELADLRATVPPQPPVTPPNNSITDPNGNPLPAFSITSTTDPTVISNGPAPTSDPVPGLQVSGYYAEDPAGQARFLLRLPLDWNGKLVVAGASGTRSEFNGDWAWSNYVLPKGYAYASQNKGVLNFYLVSTTSATQPQSDPMSCRVNPLGLLANWWVHFYDVDPAKPFTQWTYYMLQTASLAQKAVKVAYGKPARRTYAVGTSNGGYQVRRAVEEGPNLFDGGVDWEGTYINPNGPNLLIELPVAVKNFPLYAAGNYDINSDAAKAILAAGYPPDIVRRDANGVVTDSLWLRYYVSYWEVTACQWQQRFDPAFQTFTGATTNLGDYDFFARKAIVPSMHLDLAAVATTGKIKKPLITVAGTMDALLPPENHARAYERAVNASRKGNNERRAAQFRLYEVQNGNHLESYALPTAFPELRVIQPHAHKAFDLLVDHVEKNAPLPPSQCIPKDGTISATPVQAGHCEKLLD